MPLKSSAALQKPGWGAKRKEYAMEEKKPHTEAHPLSTNLNTQIIPLCLIKSLLQVKSRFWSVWGEKKKSTFSPTKPINNTGFRFKIQFQRSTTSCGNTPSYSSTPATSTSSWKAGRLHLQPILTAPTESMTLNTCLTGLFFLHHNRET